MNGAAVQLGTIAGIRLRIHASWLLALFLATASLSVQLAPSSGRAAPAVGFVTALSLFASVVAHELGHALVARARGVGVSSITLFIFGGVASLESEPRRARDTIAIAIAGPLVSIALGIGALGVARSGMLPAIAGEPLGWLGRVNLGLAVFNLLPGLPLDGGQILQGVLWAWRGDRAQATLGASRAGRAIGWTFLLLGGARALFGTIADGLWIGFMGWFLLETARSYAEAASMRAALAGASIVDAITARYPIVDARASLSVYLRQVAAADGRRAHVVVRDGDIVGVVTVDHVLRIPREAWDVSAVGAVAASVASVPRFDVRTPLFDVLTTIGAAPFVFVTNPDSTIVGVVDREHLADIAGIRVDVLANAHPPPRSRAPAWT